MDTSALIWIAVALAVVLVVVGVALAMRRRAQTRALRRDFGDEYDHAVEERGGRRHAERDLSERQKRHQTLDLRPLDPDRAKQIGREWHQTQESFVDHPTEAVATAHRLVRSVMSERGYLVDDTQESTGESMVSVDHPDVVQDYREANRIADRSQRGDATTEELRQAMQRYRQLFTRLLEDSPR